MQRKVDQ